MEERGTAPGDRVGMYAPSPYNAMKYMTLAEQLEGGRTSIYSARMIQREAANLSPSDSAAAVADAEALRMQMPAQSEKHPYDEFSTNQCDD